MFQSSVFRVIKDQIYLIFSCRHMSHGKKNNKDKQRKKLIEIQVSDDIFFGCVLTSPGFPVGYLQARHLGSPKTLGTSCSREFSKISSGYLSANMELSEETEEKQRPVKLESVALNSIRHSFQTLDENNSGKVAKSQLQVLCASICRDIGAIYDAQHLADFKSSSTSLNFQDFTEYLQDHLLSKG